MLGSFGVFAFVIMLWMSGWLVLWLLAERLEPIQDKQRLHKLPRGWVQKLQMVVVAIEVRHHSDLPPLDSLAFVPVTNQDDSFR